jgi:hypothetical protein
VPRLGTVLHPAEPPLVLLVNDGGPPAPGATNSHGTSRGWERRRQKWGSGSPLGQQEVWAALALRSLQGGLVMNVLGCCGGLMDQGPQGRRDRNRGRRVQDAPGRVTTWTSTLSTRWPVLSCHSPCPQIPHTLHSVIPPTKNLGERVLDAVTRHVVRSPRYRCRLIRASGASDGHLCVRYPNSIGRREVLAPGWFTG